MGCCNKVILPSLLQRIQKKPKSNIDIVKAKYNELLELSTIDNQTDTFIIDQEYLNPIELTLNFSFVIFIITQKRYNLIKFINRLKDDIGGYKTIINTRELQSWLKNESLFDKTYPVLKSRHILGKNINPSLVVELLGEKRVTWDKNIDKYEETIRISPEVNIVYNAIKAPFAFIKARDFIEKRIVFNSEDITYIYCSSVPDYIYSQTLEYSRCTTIFSVMVLCEENKDLVLYCISQADLNTGSLAQSFAMPFLKKGLQDFNTNLLNQLITHTS